jgi:hypothetical protein
MYSFSLVNSAHNFKIPSPVFSTLKRLMSQIPPYFNQNYAQLKARGKSVDNVHTILLNAFLLGVLDATFQDYMCMLQDNWMDQTGDMRNATHEDIMKKAKTKYDLLVNSGKWGEK